MMKLVKYVIMIFGILTISLLLIRTQTNKPTQIQPPILPQALQEKHVLTYFYFWYDLPSGVHSTALGDHPADENTSYKKVNWFKTQLLDMNEAGIDILLAVYWSEFEPSSEIGLKNLVDARRELIRERKEPPTVALFLDTGLFDRLSGEEKDFTKEKGKQRFYGFIKEFYERVPQKHWGHIEERPIIWLWGGWFGISFDQDTFDYIYENFTQDFGVRPYIVREQSWNYAAKPTLFGRYRLKTDFSQPISTDDFYKWAAVLDGFQDIGSNVASVGPGYDERHLTERERGLFKDRNGGKWYEDNFKKAVGSGKPLIAIETWNEFHEASDIAESKEYGRQYIEITKRLTRQFWSTK